MIKKIEELFSIKNKNFIITGGAQGIGAAVAEAAAACGANIIIFDIQGDKASKKAEDIHSKYNVKTFSYEVDVTNPINVQNSLEKAHDEMGEIELLFNNAGIVLQKSVIDLQPDEWLNVINVNLNGIFFMAQAFGRYLIKRKIKGSIVNTASMSAMIVNYPQQQASYNTSKAAVVQLTKSLAIEWAEHGIRVNCISPGYIFTELTSFVRKDWRDFWCELTPLKRMGKPEEVVGGVLYLLSDSASFTTGTNLVMDGGFISI